MPPTSRTSATRALRRQRPIDLIVAGTAVSGWSKVAVVACDCCTRPVDPLGGFRCDRCPRPER